MCGGRLRWRNCLTNERFGNAVDTTRHTESLWVGETDCQKHCRGERLPVEFNTIIE